MLSGYSRALLNCRWAACDLPLLESSVSRVRWREWFALNELAGPNGRASSAFDRGALVISAAVQGLGIALETVRFAEDEITAGHLVRLGDGRFKSILRHMHFVTYRARQKSAIKITIFRDWLLSAADCAKVVHTSRKP
jgi:DNA-binding transcriptional LysR family regulator